MDKNQKNTIDFLRSSTARLAVTYLAIIMLMSIAFSMVLYNISNNQLHRQTPVPALIDQNIGYEFQNNLTPRQAIKNFLATRADEARVELIWNLILLNISVGILGAGVSYYLARKSLEPIEAVMASKDRFISDASHELRTPLTSLQTTNEVALRNPNLTIKQAKELIGENVNETKRLKYLTDGLLGLLKENQNGAAMKEVSLQNIVSDTMNQVVVNAQKRKITVDDKVPKILFSTDPNYLLQILTILLENAIKYSPSKSTVTIDAKKTNSKITINIKDEGVGIKAADLPHIFDRFYRAENSRSSTKVQGYGLGLSIAKRLIDELGGSISVKSKISKGSTFTIKLPLSK
ncbi:MAG: HAMP domain-containing sensor histidine kinase [Candidatus Saccharibacteria bacterium]|nr:HAMP domain-containing sensor histidine kinase [Candidatus Saccharibacteria bacterium]